MGRCRIQMSVDRYKDIKCKIVSRKEGEDRKYIKENYDVVDDEFFLKSIIKDICESKSAPLGIASVEPSDDEDKFKNWIATNAGFIQGLTSTIGDEGSNKTRLDDIQAFMLDCRHKFLWADKTRQFGFSFALAARGLAESMLSKKHTSIFVSFNEDESKEKIVYARELYESLPSKYKLGRRLKYDNKTSLVFEKCGDDSVETRILSYPQRIVRGKGGSVHVRIDEAAHCFHFRKIYVSAVPVLSRGESSLWVGSSPAGKGGLFYEIGADQDNLYPLFLRVHVHWWDVAIFCKDVKKARLEAPNMMTDERVQKFATNTLSAIRKSMLIEDFQQEYECAYNDEAYSYFPWDLIHKCTPQFNLNGDNLPDYDSPADNLSENDGKKTGIDFYTDFDDFMDAINKGIFSGPFLMGFDVGRKKDASEISFIEEDPKTHHQIVRCIVTMKNVRFPEQRSRTINMVNRLGRKLVKCGVDYTNIGMNIAEDIEDISYQLVEKLPFNNNAWKEQAVRQMKYRMEMGGISFPLYNDFLKQVHSIKKILLPGGALRFDAEKANDHHGDKLWSVVAASEMGYSVLDPSEAVMDFDKRIFGKNGQLIGNTPNRRIINTPRVTIDKKFDAYSAFPVGFQMPSLPSPAFSGFPGFSKQSTHGLDMSKLIAMRVTGREI